MINKIFKIKKYNKYIILFILIFFLIIAFICANFILHILPIIFNKLESLNKNPLAINTDNYISNIKDHKSELNKLFENRYLYINDNQLYVGNNLKELENNYYDFKIQVDERTAILKINKLFITTASDKIYDEEYLDKIIELLNLLFEFNYTINQKETLKQNVIKNYTNMRKNYLEDVDILDNILIEKCRIVSSIKESILIVKIN